jgi:hypothetical protein
MPLFEIGASPNEHRLERNRTGGRFAGEIRHP